MAHMQFACVIACLVVPGSTLGLQPRAWTRTIANKSHGSQQDAARTIARHERIKVLGASCGAADAADESQAEPCEILRQLADKMDTGDPKELQQAFFQYTAADVPLKLAITKDHFLEIYNQNVGERLTTYKDILAFSFGPSWTVQSFTPTEMVATREGTVTMKTSFVQRLGLKEILKKGFFEESKAAEVKDCDSCVAQLKTELVLIDGTWKIADVTMLKLE